MEKDDFDIEVQKMLRQVIPILSNFSQTTCCYLGAKLSAACCLSKGIGEEEYLDIMKLSYRTMQKNIQKDEKE